MHGLQEGGHKGAAETAGGGAEGCKMHQGVAWRVAAGVH